MFKILGSFITYYSLLITHISDWASVMFIIACILKNLGHFNGNHLSIFLEKLLWIKFQSLEILYALNPRFMKILVSETSMNFSDLNQITSAIGRIPFVLSLWRIQIPGAIELWRIWEAFKLKCFGGPFSIRFSLISLMIDLGLDWMMLCVPVVQNRTTHRIAHWWQPVGSI